MNRKIFGLGTGRCGTDSLAALLNAQEDTYANHETLVSPWVPNKGRLYEMFKLMDSRSEAVVGEVALYYLNYVPLILEKDPTTKFVCLQRDKAATVKSYDVKTGYNPTNGLGERNHWTARDSAHWNDSWRLDPTWDRCYPKYDLSRLDGIAKYWDDYYEIATGFSEKYPDNFMIISMEGALNDADKQESMLRFLGYDNPIVVTNIKKNSGPQGGHFANF